VSTSGTAVGALNKHRARFTGWTERLLDATSTPDVQRDAAVA
jgi:hypothetical protein